MEPEGNTRFSIDDINNNDSDNTFNSEEKAVTLPPKTQGYGQEGNRTETRRSDADQRDESVRLRDRSSGGTSGSCDPGDIERLSEGLASEQHGDYERGSKAEQRAVGNQIISNAKKHRLYIEPSQTKQYGERIIRAFRGEYCIHQRG